MCPRARPATTTRWRSTSGRKAASRPRRSCRGGGRDRIRSTLQIARFEMGAFGFAETEAVAEIGIEIAIVGVDGLERGGEKRFLHRAQHLFDLVRQVAAMVGIPAVEAVGQKIVFRDGVPGNAERMQDQRA